VLTAPPLFTLSLFMLSAAPAPALPPGANFFCPPLVDGAADAEGAAANLPRLPNGRARFSWTSVIYLTAICLFFFFLFFFSL
jgi:hypothetical protein